MRHHLCRVSVMTLGATCAALARRADPHAGLCLCGARVRSAKRWPRGALVSTLAVSLLAGCGSGATEPTPPGGPGAMADVRGAWVQTNGQTRTWTLDQSISQASGTAAYAQLHSPNIGVVSGTGRVSGAVSERTYRFVETYQSVNMPSRPSATSCSLDVDGELTINGNTMRGTIRESVACLGLQLAQVTRDLVMQRR